MSNPSPPHWVVGTSGHIDHGKSTLVKALTGTDPDRLAEEKSRGITIDLGFARWVSPGQAEISFIDVPGHERFVHNMLAGAHGLDAVLLVVAADEGVMPQTLEHLHICRLLGVRRGIIALTRADLADAPRLTQTQDEVRAAVQGTFLEPAPLVAVSAVTGQGMEQLREQLTALAEQALPQDQARRQEALALPFRLPVDRVFTLKGFGTVVTGTVVSGRYRPAEELMLYPQGLAVRVRGLQVHGQPAEQVEAGQRAALNLTGLGKDALGRGCQLAAPGSLGVTRRVAARVRLLEGARLSRRVRLHLGTQDVSARVSVLGAMPPEGHLPPGSDHWVMLHLEAPAAARWGDRFILRGGSPQATLGGGVVADPLPGASRHGRAELPQRLERLAGDNPPWRVEEAAALQSPRPLAAPEGMVRTGLGPQAYQQALTQALAAGRVMELGERIIHPQVVARLGKFLLRVLEQQQRLSPERGGLTRAEAAGKLAALYTEKEIHRLLAHLAAAQVIALAGERITLPGAQTQAPANPQLAKVTALLEQAGLQPPRLIPLLEAAGLDRREGEKLLKTAAHQGALVKVKDDLFYLPTALAQAEQALKTYLAGHGSITVVEYKDLLGVGRKHAVDLLEYFDGKKITLRMDNTRVLRT